MKTYWYLRHSPDMHPLTARNETARWQLPTGLASKIRLGHRLVLATWDDPLRLGSVRAFAVCERLEGGIAIVRWQPATTTLRPRSAGYTHWRTKEYFEFAASVVARYCLADLVAEHLGEIEDCITSEPREYIHSNQVPQPGAYRSKIPGHIYVLKSPYGYKIGKTVHLTDRMRLFAVKLPFHNALEYHFQTDDYTSMERTLHLQYAQKRLEGEWFDLTAADLAHIRQTHPQRNSPTNPVIDIGS